MTVGGRRAPAGYVGALRETFAGHTSDGELVERLAVDGYVLVRDALDAALVLEARAEVMAQLHAIGEIAAPATAGIATGTSERAALRPDLGAFWRTVSEGTALRALTHGAALRELLGRFIGAPALPFDFLWLRATPPGRATPPHFDHPYMSRGSARVLTAWIPIGDVPLEEGPLAVVEGAHRFTDLVEAYRHHDVDRDPERPGFVTEDTLGLARERGTRLLSADMRAGDVVVFGMFTLHCSLDNSSRNGRVRLSCDTRFQPATDARDERWFGDPPPGHGGRSYGGLGSARPLTAPALKR